MKRADIERLLPGIFQRTGTYEPVTLKGSPLYALLEVMAGLHEPDEQALAALPAYFNPYLAAPDFVPFLAAWVDLAQLLQSPATGEWLAAAPLDSGRLRALVAGAAMLSQWRGTAKALLFYLETATGVQGFNVDERVPDPDNRPIPFHIRVQAPKEARPYSNLIARIVQLEKPVYVTAEVQFQP